ncbi:MAG: DUF58 domain-containing protein, partial [Bacillota bacterium]|nr:DUF58 domain-containing protein [Bacillota bacterium]
MWKTRLIMCLWLLGIIILHFFINNLGTRTILILSIVIPLLSVVFTWISAKGISIELRFPEICEKGQQANLSIFIENSSPFSIPYLACQLVAENHLTDERVEENIGFSAKGRFREAVDFNIGLSHCGKVSINVDSFTAYDLFNLFKWDIPFQAAAVITVMPKTFMSEVEVVDDTGNALDSLKYSMLKAGNDPSETFALREYVPGDSIRNIHWKLSQKTDSLMVRELSFPLADKVLILFEASLIPGIENISFDRLDAMTEVFSSLCKGLIEQEIVFTVGWKSTETESYECCQVAN